MRVAFLGLSEARKRWPHQVESWHVSAEYLTLLESKLAGKRYLKDWHFVRAFSQEELYTYAHSDCTEMTRAQVHEMW